MPQIIRCGMFDIQVCVPEDWSEDQIIAFAEKEYPCGTEQG